MLKYIYKSFLVSLLCSSLLMLEISYQPLSLGFRLNTARAESVQTGGAKEEGIGALASTLEMAAIGLVASRLFKYGKITPDIGVAAAGGLAFIAGEIAAYQGLKKAKEEIETEIKRSKKTGDLTDEQRQSLIRLIQMYRKSKDTAETKKSLQLAAAAAFAVAGVMAYFFTAQDALVAATCRAAVTAAGAGGISAASASCAALCTASFGTGCAACTPVIGTCGTAITGVASALSAYDAARAPVGPSCTKFSSVTAARTAFVTSLATAKASCADYAPAAAVAAAMSTGCDGKALSDVTNETACSAPVSVPSLPKEFFKGLNPLQNKHYANVKPIKENEVKLFVKNFFNKYIISSAKADLFSPMGIASSAAITLIMMFSATAAMKVDTLILTPNTRGIIWAFMAAGAYAASTSTDSQIQKIEQDIQKLEDLVNTINNNNNGNKASNALAKKSTTIKTLDNSGITAAEFKKEDIEVSDNALPCVSGKDSSGKCNSFTQTLNSLPGVNNLPEGIVSDMNQISRMAEGLNGSSKISGSTLNEASNVAGNANALMQKLKDAKKQAQSKIASTGSNDNLENMEKDFSNDMKGAFAQAITKSKVNMKDVYASLGNSSLNLSGANGVANSAKGTDAKKGGGSGFVMPKLDFNVPATPKMTDIKEEKKEEPKVEQAAAATATSIDEYEMTNDINTDKNTSIFDVISRRYEKSGYPRLFKRLNE